MNGYDKYTPVRIALPFMLGVALVLGAGPRLPFQVLFIIAAFALAGAAIAYTFLRISFGLRWIFGLLANILLLLAGSLSVWITDRERTPELLPKTREKPEGIYACKIEYKPVAKALNSVTDAILVAELDSTGRWIGSKGKVRISFRNDSLCSGLRYGDMIIFRGYPSETPGTSNPWMFNYRKYLINRGIYRQIFLEPGQWQYIGRGKANPVKAGAEICRENFLATLQNFGIDGQEFALLSALLLGTRDYLENETIREFSYAGAIHVLSVSGLHVGIMVVLVDKMLFFLKRNRRGRVLHQALIILSIWAYAFITGLPSSVIRASLMFSLLAAGKMMKRSTDNFNILAVAAFAQLCINPYELTDVGFQLSYLAVLGIFAFYQPLNELISSSRRVITWLWSVLAVSIAAQLATFPLASYYFNMFPVYFLLTNLIVVPLAGVITYFAVALLIIGAAGIYYGWLAFPLDWSLKIMLEAVEMIQSWPGAVIQQIVFSVFQVALVYCMILSLYGFFILENKKWIFVFGGSVLMFLFIYTDIQFKQINSGKIVVYNVPGHTAIDLIHGKSCLFIGDSLILQDEKKVRFQIAPNRMHSGIQQINCLDLSNDDAYINREIMKSSSFIDFLSIRIVIIDEKWKRFSAGNKFPCRLVVFTGKTKVNPADVFARLDMEQVVIDGSVPFYLSDRIRQSCSDRNIPCHPVKDLGAYMLECY